MFFCDVWIVDSLENSEFKNLMFKILKYENHLFNMQKTIIIITTRHAWTLHTLNMFFQYPSLPSLLPSLRQRGPLSREWSRRAGPGPSGPQASGPSPLPTPGANARRDEISRSREPLNSDIALAQHVMGSLRRPAQVWTWTRLREYIMSKNY